MQFKRKDCWEKTLPWTLLVFKMLMLLLLRLRQKKEILLRAPIWSQLKMMDIPDILEKVDLNLSIELRKESFMANSIWTLTVLNSMAWTKLRSQMKTTGTFKQETTLMRFWKVMILSMLTKSNILKVDLSLLKLIFHWQLCKEKHKRNLELNN